MNDTHTNCLIHPVGTTDCSLEYNQNQEAVLGCLQMRLDLERLGTIDTVTWETTVESQS